MSRLRDERVGAVIQFRFDDHRLETIGEGARVERHLHGAVNVSVKTAHLQAPFLLIAFYAAPRIYVLAGLYFGERMMGVDERLQPFLQHMRIDLRRRNVSMSERAAAPLSRSAPRSSRWLAKA